MRIRQDPQVAIDNLKRRIEAASSPYEKHLWMWQLSEFERGLEQRARQQKSHNSRTLSNAHTRKTIANIVHITSARRLP